MATLSSKTRRVSIGGPRPLLSKSNSAAGNFAAKDGKPTPATSSSAKKASVTSTKAVAVVPEIVQVRREKEALEARLAQQKKEADEKTSELTSHIAVLEDLFEKKKETLEFVESKLEALGLDPIAVKPFERDESDERAEYLKQDEEEFEERMEYLRQGLAVRNRLLEDSMAALATINKELDALDEENNENLAV